MSPVDPKKTFPDDKRFDKLLDRVEDLYTCLLEEATKKEGVDTSKEEISEYVNEVLDQFAMVLLAFKSEIITTSKSSSGEQIFDLRLSVPTGSLRETAIMIVNDKNY